MDKFGVFKLLGSLFDFYMKNYSSDKTVKNGAENSNGFNPLSGLFGKGFSEKSNQNSDISGKTASEKQNKSGNSYLKAPLQNSMLNVMKNHDLAVNRIRKNK